MWKMCMGIIYLTFVQDHKVLLHAGQYFNQMSMTSDEVHSAT
jgi:hypothetical protein